MAKIWTHPNGQNFEMKKEDGEWWHRRQGKGDDKWKHGTPPGFSQKPTRPLSGEVASGRLDRAVSFLRHHG
jgi:hypothetical protein